MKRCALIWVLAMSCTISCAISCTIERQIPLERFACEKGGPCDAGVVAADAIANSDAEPIDQGENADAGNVAPDAEQVDGTFPVASCSSAVPLSPSGVEMGIIDENDTNDFNGSCGVDVGGRDEIFYFYTPGRLASLLLSTERSPGLDTNLYFYRNECVQGGEVDCNDDFDPNGIILTSRIENRNLPAAAYYVVVDVLDSMTRGNFVLDVSGKIAANEACDPALSFLSCDHSFCVLENGQHRCVPPTDCARQTCTLPPAVTCPNDVNIAPGATLTLRGTATDNGSLIAQYWDLLDAPLDGVGSFAGSTATATISVPLAGDYVLLFTAVDDRRQASSCQTRVHAQSNAPLRVELVYEATNSGVSELFDVDLHMLDPAATAWFGTDDCYPTTCTIPLPWGAVHSGNTMGPSGVESVEVSDPLRDGSDYELGVHFADDDFVPPARVRLLVHCDGDTNTMIPEKLLANGSVDEPNTADFWKAARVRMNAMQGCDVIMRDQVVTTLQAHMGR